MNFLLDTHIWLWNELEPARIKPQVYQALAEPNNELWLSPVSVWEFALLLEKKKMVLQHDFRSWVDGSIQDLQLQEASLTWEVAHALKSAMPTHKDPADRFLAATARVYGLTLVTADERLANAAGVEVLWNG